MQSTLERPDKGRASHNGIRVVEYTDPYSIWCWGYEPLLRRFEVRYPHAIDVEVRMGGLFEDFTPMRESWTRMSGGRWQDSIRAFFQGVASQHRMPMDADAMMREIDDFRSTWPACVAFKAAEAQGREAGWRFLRAMREAVCVEGKQIAQAEVQREIARATRLDEGRFAAALADGSAEAAFAKDREECAELGIAAFPTILVHRGGDVLRVDGWQPWEVFDDALRKLAPDLAPRPLAASVASVRDLLERYPRCATREVSAILGTPDDEAELLLEELEADGNVVRRVAGTGLFWSLPAIAPPTPDRTERVRERA